MGQKYKIFYRRHYFVFDHKLGKHQVDLVLHNINVELLSAILFYLKETKSTHIIQVTQENGFETFKSLFRIIVAAGGAVINTNGDLLLMKRKGVWDLPKGKLDKGEEIEAAAIREVEEECNVFDIKIKSPLSLTYHIYFDKKWLLKETRWYNMKSKDWKKAKPQVEEDIEKVKWIKLSDLDIDGLNTYQNVRQVLNQL